MDWGEYQGRTIDELRERHGVDFAANERRGLDLAPPGGESPRAVQARLAPLLAELAAAGRPTLAVTHRGVIRAIYARAAGWNMTGEPPDVLDLYALHVFVLEAGGAPRIERLNVALADRAEPVR
jgi:probable phosphoglycerate mutase